ncbi:MAG: adenosylmethionine--8-amino-7-oxononanoate transaminase [Planctomycetota bacterium]
MSDLVARDAACLWHPYTPHAVEPAPLPVRRAQGAVLELEDGRELIDAVSSWWTCLHGHGHPRLVEAMRRQAEELDHVLFAGVTHAPAVRLAEELVRLAPPGLSRVFYSDDGSTAVEVALKMAYHSCVRAGEPQRTVFLALEGGYHGDTFGAMAVGDPAPFFAPYAPLLFAVRRVPPEAAALEVALAAEKDRVAALIVEPLVQGAAGMRMHDAGFLRAARAACDAHGVFLIADEVMTGFGRTGATFACGKAGIAPDLLCLAKGLANGMLPLAATLVAERIYASFLGTDRASFFPHGHSMTANPVGCAVALASLELSRATAGPSRLDALGRRIHAALADLADDPRVADLRRTGGIVAFDLVPPAGETPGYHSSLVPHLRAAAIEAGVLLRPLGNAVYAMPPACTTDAQADAIAGAMRRLVDVA